MVIDFNIRVKVRLAGDEFYGEEGIVVLHQPSYSIPNGVAFGAKRIRYYGDNELEVLDKFCAACDQLIADEDPYIHKEENTVSVSVGDKVKHTFYGHEGVVTYIYKDGASAVVETGGKEVVFSTCYLVAIPEQAE